MEIATIINLLILLANLAVCALNVKLYTERMKDRNMNARANATKP